MSKPRLLLLGQGPGQGLSTHCLECSVFADYVEAGLAAGSDGYLLKDCEPDQLIAKASEIVAGIRRKAQERGRS